MVDGPLENTFSLACALIPARCQAQIRTRVLDETLTGDRKKEERKMRPTSAESFSPSFTHAIVERQREREREI